MSVLADLDVIFDFKTVELVEQLKHSTLDLTITRLLTAGNRITDFALLCTDELTYQNAWYQWHQVHQ